MKRLTLLLATLLLAACAGISTPKATVVGEVFYVQRIALPPSAILTVSLQDVSLADTAAPQLAHQSGPINGQVPLPFRLEYHREQLQPGHRYAVSARIEADGKLLFISTGQHGVKLDGTDPQPLRVRLNPARSLP